MRKSAVLSALMALLWLAPASAWWQPTHEEITKAAAKTPVGIFVLDDVLKKYFDLPQGLTTSVTEKATGTTLTALDWIARGANQEDVPDCRAGRHFHEPLKQFPWNGAGLSEGLPTQASGVFCAAPLPFLSSVQWMQTREQTRQTGIVGSGNWALQDLEDYMLNAIVLPTQDGRNPFLVKFLQALGHVAHLLQDATQPQHVRMETHIRGSLLEEFADGVRQKDPVRFQSLLGISVIDPYPYHVSRLIDSDKYDGTCFPMGTSVGVAEFTSRWFLSPFRMFGARPCPTEAEIQPSVQAPVPNRPTLRQYYRLIGGPPVEHFVRRSIALRPADGSVLAYGVYQLPEDKLILSDYAAALLPRAVGVTAQLFGALLASPVTVTQVAGGGPGEVRLAVKNTSAVAVTIFDMVLYTKSAPGLVLLQGAAAGHTALAAGASIEVQAALPPGSPSGEYLVAVAGNFGAAGENLVWPTTAQIISSPIVYVCLGSAVQAQGACAMRFKVPSGKGLTIQFAASHTDPAGLSTSTCVLPDGSRCGSGETGQPGFVVGMPVSCIAEELGGTFRFGERGQCRDTAQLTSQEFTPGDNLAMISWGGAPWNETTIVEVAVGVSTVDGWACIVAPQPSPPTPPLVFRTDGFGNSTTGCPTRP